MAGAALAWLLGPRPGRLDGPVTGDRALADQVQAALDDRTGYRGLAVATIEGDTVRVAGLGESGDPDSPAVDAGSTRFEIGSVAKPMTGMLLSDAVDRGAVRPDQRLDQLLPDAGFDDPAVGRVSLEELASHRSGLPGLPPTGFTGRAARFLASVRGEDPYAGEDAASILAAAERASIGDGRGEVHYSNFGMALLGQVLARQAGTSYPQLLQDRLLGPAGLTDTTLRLDDAGAPDAAATGFRTSGQRVDRWTASGIAPAGSGVWSTARGLARFVAATMDSSAPGAGASTPRFEDDVDSRIGYGWFTASQAGRDITWHNGATGGFTAYVGFDREADRGVVVLSNTNRRVEPLGRELLTGDPGPVSRLGVPGIILLAWALLTAAPVAWAVLRGGRLDRSAAISAAVTTGSALVLARQLGSWGTLPPLLWSVSAVLALVLLATAAIGWRRRAWIGYGDRRRRIAGLTGSVLVAVALVGVALGLP